MLKTASDGRWRPGDGLARAVVWSGRPDAAWTVEPAEGVPGGAGMRAQIWVLWAWMGLSGPWTPASVGGAGDHVSGMAAVVVAGGAGLHLIPASAALFFDATWRRRGVAALGGDHGATTWQEGGFPADRPCRSAGSSGFAMGGPVGLRPWMQRRGGDELWRRLGTMVVPARAHAPDGVVAGWISTVQPRPTMVVVDCQSAPHAPRMTRFGSPLLGGSLKASPFCVCPMVVGLATEPGEIPA